MPCASVRGHAHDDMGVGRTLKGLQYMVAHQQAATSGDVGRGGTARGQVVVRRNIELQMNCVHIDHFISTLFGLPTRNNSGLSSPSTTPCSTPYLPQLGPLAADRSPARARETTSPTCIPLVSSDRSPDWRRSLSRSHTQLRRTRTVQQRRTQKVPMDRAESETRQGSG